MKPYSHYIFLFLTLFLSSFSFAQRKVLIDRTEKNETLFDDTQTYSLLSILQMNKSLLGQYSPSGMDKKLVEELKETANGDEIISLVHPINSVIPLKDMNDEDSIRELPDGSLEYVYPSDEIRYVDLTNISRITIDYEDNFETIKRIHFWKKYKGKSSYSETFDADGELLKLDAFKVVTPLLFGDEIVDTENGSSLWSMLRDSAMIHFEIEKGRLEKNGPAMYYSEYEPLEFLPTESNGYWLLSRGRQMWRIFDENEEPWAVYCEEEDLVDQMPFGLLKQPEEGYEEFKDSIHGMFETCQFLKIESTSPLVDEYGNPMTVTGDDGVLYFLYPGNKYVYFWVEIENPIVFIQEDLLPDSLGETNTQIESVFFTNQIEEGEPTLIAHLDYESKYSLYFSEYTPIRLSEQPWSIAFEAAKNNKKNQFNLDKKKDRLKFEEMIKSD